MTETQTETLHLQASRSGNSPRGMYLLTLERNQCPRLYDHLVEQGFEECPACDATPELTVVRVPGSETDLRRAVAQGLGVEMRDVSASVGRITSQQADERVLYIDAPHPGGE